jgi:hypothetical protein
LVVVVVLLLLLLLLLLAVAAAIFCCFRVSYRTFCSCSCLLPYGFSAESRGPEVESMSSRLRARSSSFAHSFNFGAGSARSLAVRGMETLGKVGYLFKVGRKMKIMRKRYAAFPFPRPTLSVIPCLVFVSIVVVVVVVMPRVCSLAFANRVAVSVSVVVAQQSSRSSAVACGCCRWFTLQHNFLYWYTGEGRGAKLLGVLYLEGSYVSRLPDDNWTPRGYYGFAIHTRYAVSREASELVRWRGRGCSCECVHPAACVSLAHVCSCGARDVCCGCSSVHGEHNRFLYAKGEEERLAWLDILQRAARTVPFDEVYTLGVSEQLTRVTDPTAPHRTAPHRTAPHRTAPHRTAPHRTAPHRTAPHRTAPHRLSVGSVAHTCVSLLVFVCACRWLCLVPVSAKSAPVGSRKCTRRRPRSPARSLR